MQLSLKASGGPRAGQIIPVSHGLTIGRQDAELMLDDPRVSSKHARITQAGDRWRLSDTGSKNGIRDHQGEKVVALELIPGQKFTIGDTEFEVISDAPLPEPSLVVPKVKRAPKKRRQVLWNEALANHLDINLEAFQNRVSEVVPLEPALVLEFVRGPQVSSRWVLGFGPRRIGAATLDLPLREPNAPPVCFQVTPSTDGLIFSTSLPKLVRLNGQEVDSAVLAVGDTIQINSTLIEVDFAE